MAILSDPPTLGRAVIYFDDSRQPHAAIVAHVHDNESRHIARPSCNLATFRRNGQVVARISVEPAYDDGERWHLLNKWAYPDEVPDEAWNHLPPAHGRHITIGVGETIETT